MQAPLGSHMDIAAPRPRARSRGVGRATLMLLLLCCNKASAAALGKATTSVGLFAALAALAAIQTWPAYLAPSAVSTVGVVLIAGAALWWWRARSNGRAADFAVVPGLAGGVALCGPPGGDGVRPAVLLPAGLDPEALLTQFRGQFVRVQDAWDRHEMQVLGELMTPDLLAEVCREVTESSAGSVKAPGSTDIVMLRCELVGFETLTRADVATVEFSGLIRESEACGAVPFRELWMLTQSKSAGTGWRLARHQALL